MIKKILLGAATLIVVLVLAAGIYTWNPLPKTPSAQVLSAAASTYDVEIIRDNWGVPHIFGKTDNDAAFGLAYAHAEDDFETIQETVAATRGVLARYKGVAAARTDYLIELLHVWDTIEARYDSDVPEDVKAYAQAYADGLNLYASENLDDTWTGLAPFTPQDLFAGALFRTPFFYGFDETLLDVYNDERVQSVSLDPGAGRESWLIGPKTAPPRGSNAFAVAPERSGDDTTRLVINSHQPMTGPVAWWEAHMVSEEGLDIHGGVFPGSPTILHGFNRHLGWANTVSKPDLADVYVLTVNPDNPNQYQLDGDWVEFEVETAKMAIKLWGPFALTVKREVLTSKHGPAVRTETGTYAFRYAGMQAMRQTEQRMRTAKARNWDEFYAAMAIHAVPALNYIYADKDGVIAMIHNGQYPNRAAGWDWTGDMPGDRSDLIWSDYLPYDRVPILRNPQSGLVFDANNQPFSATDGPDNLRSEMFSSTMGLQTDETNRSLRIVELTDGETLISRDALLAIKFDNSYAQGSVADDTVKAVLSNDWSSDDGLSAAADHLAAWTYSTDKIDRHAALGVLTTIHAVTEKLTGIPAPEPAQAFQDAVDYLNRHYGRIDPEWGEVNRLVRGEVNLPVSGGPDILRAIYPAEIGDDGRLEANAGDTWIALVEWDAAGNLAAQIVHQYGTATLDTSSPHYADQAPLFAAEDWRPALLERAEIEANASRSYRPGR
ncbi:MAG: penicillin acylase family protein [Pseudomonadota bacterium]